MQADHHYAGRLVQIQWLVIAAQELLQLVIKDFDNLLSRRNRTQNFLAQRLALNFGDEVFRDLKMNVGLQQSQANLTKSVVNISLRDAAMTPEVLEDVLKLVG